MTVREKSQSCLRQVGLVPTLPQPAKHLTESPKMEFTVMAQNLACKGHTVPDMH